MRVQQGAAPTGLAGSFPRLFRRLPTPQGRETNSRDWVAVLSVQPLLVSAWAHVAQTQVPLIPGLFATQPGRRSVSTCRLSG